MPYSPRVSTQHWCWPSRIPRVSTLIFWVLCTEYISGVHLAVQKIFTMASARPSSSAAGRRVARLCRHVAYSDTSTTTRNTVATTTSGGGAGGGAGAADSALLAAAPTASSYTESEANNVPWLPLPSLADTMARLQEFAGPVCSKADMEDLAAAVREFLADPNAHVLQKVWSPMRAAIQTTARNSHHCTVCHFVLTAFGGAPQSEAPSQLYVYIHYGLPG